MRLNAYRVYAGNRESRFLSSQKCVGSAAVISWPLGGIAGFRDQGNLVRKKQKECVGSAAVFSWLRGGMADTMRSTENRGLSCQQRNAQHHSNTRRKNPARVKFSAERVFRETKKTRGRNLDRRSPSQKAKQQNARKPANHLRGYRTEVLGKISGVKVRTEIASESARQILTQNWRQLPARVAHCAPMWPKFSYAADSRRNLASRPEK